MNVTTKKRRANRRNAQRSTGPKSKSGKSTVALNSVVHGLRSLRPVIPGLEDVKDWDRHRTAVISQLAPAGVIEAAIAERVALGFWRLARSASAEGRLFEAIKERNKSGAIQSAGILDGFVRRINDRRTVWEYVESESRDRGGVAHLWDEIERGCNANPVDEEAAIRLIDTAVTEPEWMRLGQPFAKEFSWPPGSVSDLRRMVDWIAGQLSAAPGLWIKQKAVIARTEAKAAKDQMERLRRAGEIAEEMALVSDTLTENLLRYETSVHRALLRDLHELQRLQAMRLGISEAVPVAVDITNEG